MKLLPKVILILSGLILALLVSEIYLHFHLSNHPRFEWNCFEKGGYYWFRLKPNYHCIVKSLSGSIPDTDIKTNELGLRNPPIGGKAPDTKRVLFLGDSFTFGAGVSEDQTFPRLIEKMSQEKKLESINASLMGTEPGYYYLTIKNYPQLNPDIVVVGFYPINDIYDDEFEPRWQSLDEKGLPIKITSDTGWVDDQGSIQTHPSLVLNSYLLTKLLGKDSRLKYQRICLFKPNYSLPGANCSSLVPHQEMVKKLFLGMKKITDQRNQKLLVVIIPANFQIYDELRIKYDIALPLTQQDKFHISNDYGQFFSQNNIEFLDLLPELLKHKDEKTYFPLDDHWNETGHQIAAQAISEKLQEILK